MITKDVKSDPKFNLYKCPYCSNVNNTHCMGTRVASDSSFVILNILCSDCTLYYYAYYYINSVDILDEEELMEDKL